MSKKKTLEDYRKEIKSLKFSLKIAQELAGRWVQLGDKIDLFYEERGGEQEDGLITIGEMAAEAFGYL